MRKRQWQTDAERIEAHRAFFAQLIAARAGVAPDGELAEAFRTTPREHFVGGPPWRILSRHGFVEAPHDDPAFLYQDVVVSLGVSTLNNGEPSLHAMSLATLRPMKGDRIVHVARARAITRRSWRSWWANKAASMHTRLSRCWCSGRNRTLAACRR